MINTEISDGLFHLKDIGVSRDRFDWFDVQDVFSLSPIHLLGLSSYCLNLNRSPVLDAVAQDIEGQKDLSEEAKTESTCSTMGKRVFCCSMDTLLFV
jgi:hypothetical protein